MPQTPLSRRTFLLTAGAGIGVAKTGLAPARELVRGACLPIRNWTGLKPARELVRSGALGRIVFCRVFQGDARDSLGTLQFLLDAPPPVSVTKHGAGRATLRYPGFVASFEKARGLEEYGIVICGSHATLAIKRDGLHMFGHEA
ncbi:MAG: hypothetical protein ABSB88_11650 [Bryobacteraceae bacterium]|jgi:hypothetical protein